MTRCATPPPTAWAPPRTDAWPTGRDHRKLIDLLEAYLLDEEPSLTGNQLADHVGIPFETARLRWRSLGFSEVGGDVAAFTKADDEALRLTEELSALGLVEPTTSRP